MNAPAHPYGPRCKCVQCSRYRRALTYDTIASTLCGIGDVRHAHDAQGDSVMPDDWNRRAERLIAGLNPWLQEMNELRAMVPDDVWERATS